MMRTITFFAVGLPAPQGSKRAVVHRSTGRAVVIESSKKVKPWRQAVKYAALDAINGQPIEGPVAVTLRFYMPRPRSHYGTGRNAGTLKPSAPLTPAVRPDLDKLIRSTLDGLGDAGAITDDSRIVLLSAAKIYTSEAPSCRIEISEAL